MGMPFGGARRGRMKDMRNSFKIAMLSLVFAGLLMLPVQGQSSAGFPFSIINDGSERRPAKRTTPSPKVNEEQPARQKAKAGPRGAPRGSSTLSTIPTHSSPLTPLGTVRPMPTAPSMANPASPAAPVPGIGGVAGTPAIAPARPAGQTFQDRARDCIMSGTGQGVGPGQIGSFTQNCVNR